MNPYEETVETLRQFLRWEGYVRCDIPACNCGSWHGRDGLHARWREVKDALAEAGHPLTNANGNTPLRALKELVADRDRLRAALEQIANTGWTPTMLEVRQIARAALAGAGDAKPEPRELLCDTCAAPLGIMAEPGMHGTCSRCAAKPASASPNIAESNDRADAEAMCRLLASIWFYGAWHPETSNERSLQAILERRGWWPITEDALIAKARIAAQPPAAPATERKPAPHCRFTPALPPCVSYPDCTCGDRDRIRPPPAPAPAPEDKA